MPNMDDIAFFESSMHQHRGGIWSDAARQTRETAVSDADDVAGIRSTASEPALVEPQAEPDSEIVKDASKHSSFDSNDAPPISSDDPDNRRRTWFSSVRSDDLETLFGQDSHIESDEATRGRSLGPDNSVAPRTHSRPGSSPPDIVPPEPTFEQITPHSNSKRSSSQHSLISGHARMSSLDDNKSEPSTPISKSADNTSRILGQGASPSSFLSTLKSRAADKQALSNTAKEAMRKWGVNWGSTRKDSNGGPSEDMPDHGSVGGSRTNMADSVGSAMLKARTSYAEVRAAVAERRGRDKEEFPGTEVSRSPPIRIPESSKGKARAVSGPSGITASLSSLGGGSRYSVEETDLNSEFSTPEPTRTVAPIQMQPQGKTMSIPGIHASHRGEVMSMGYVAPQSQPPSTAEKLKNPVYRLWKNPVSSGTETQENESDGGLSSPPRPVPPPLPPRRTATSISISRSPFETERSAELSPASSATEALISIATRDNETRSSRSPSIDMTETAVTETQRSSTA